MSLFRRSYIDPKTKTRKQSDVWWFEFVFDGQRIRESSKSARKTIAAEAEKQRRKDLERARAGLPIEEPSRRIQRVADALKSYEEGYMITHRAKSASWVKERLVHVRRLMDQVLIPDLTEDRVRSYIKTRRGEGAGNRTINMELSCLSRAIGRTWRELWPRVKKLEEASDVGRALSEEEERLLLAAAGKSTSRPLLPFLEVLLWTGMRSDEARTLRWSQVDWEGGEITVGRSKTAAGKGRVIPISDQLKSSLEAHAAWCARSLGPIQPQWYVFPCMRRRVLADPGRPMRSLKKGWATVKEVAGVECRLHDLRHTFCTKLAEEGVPESTMLDMMGHVSAGMLRRYSHIRAQARRDAISAISARGKRVLPESPTVTDGDTEKKPLTH